ncbi:adenosylmethionine decarboxylase [Aquitalea sp. LB_tupeE]|uniref:adenosylmethionine decarboxylase n=1 Tax=Aquitalea sp. LB_tupeE TaxID=2748078 RepID=UPI0015BC2FE6|nr:adenosylmethionine decarboxylase [Aquitalea sp. LB_tupeE]NWK78901.1 adenosylmethionine decarboxylase [Aquitalea sp. LB_tupeE]
MNSPAFIAYGRHVFVDIWGVAPEILNNVVRLEESLITATVAEGVTVLGTMRKVFEPTGVTILLLLAESHVSLHTYPDQGKAFFDAFTCGTNYNPENIFYSFASDSMPGHYKIKHIERGVEGSNNEYY